jgi:O-antigen/teichoic acid export membrane protein
VRFSIVRNMIHRIKSNDLIFDSVKIMTGTLLGQIIMFVSLIFLTKQYSPESFGMLAFFQSVVTTVWVLATLKYDLAIPVASNLVEKILLCFGTLLLSVSFCILMFLVLSIYVNSIDTKSTNWNQLKPYYPILSVGTLIIAIYSTLELFVISEKKFNLVSIAKTSQSAGISFSQLILGYLSPSGLMLIVGYLIGYLISSLILLKGLLYHIDKIKSLFKNTNFKKDIIGVLSRYKSFPILSLPSSFANLASTNIPVLLIGSVFSAELAGFFFLAQRVIGMPIEILTNSISQVFLGNSSEQISTNPKMVLSLFIKVVKMMFLIGIIPFSVLCWQGESILIFIFGNNWEFTGTLVRIFTIMYFARMITTPLSHILNVLQLLHIQLYWDVTRLLLVICIFCITYYFKISMMNFAMIYSIAMAMMYFSHAYLGYFFLKKKSN